MDDYWSVVKWTAFCVVVAMAFIAGVELEKARWERREAAWVENEKAKQTKPDHSRKEGAL